MQLVGIVLLSVGLFNVVVQAGLIVSNESPQFIIDVTSPLNSIVSGNLSTINFTTIMKSKIFEKSFITRAVFLLYETDCATKLESKNCTDEIRNISELVNTTIGRDMEIDLTISITLFSIPNLASSLPTKIHISDLPINVFINYWVPNDVLCRAQDHILEGKEPAVSAYYQLNLLMSKPWIAKHPLSKIGFGYRTETVMRCFDLADSELTEAITTSDFLVMNIGFGNTVGVTESLSLFQKRMVYLHEKNIRFVEKFWKPFYVEDFVKEKPKAILYPGALQVGSEGHRRLLLSFIKTWKWRGANGSFVSIVVPAPYFEEVVVSANNFSVIAHVENHECIATSLMASEKVDSLAWYSPPGLEAISNYFGTLLLSYEQWNKLTAKHSHKLLTTSHNHTSEASLKIILDFGDIAECSKVQHSTKQSCTSILKELGNQPRSNFHKSVIPTVLIFHVRSEKARLGFSQAVKNYTSDVYNNLLQNVSTKYIIGCSYTLYDLNFQTSTPLIRECKAIGGNLYILRWKMYAKSQFKTEDEYLFFENNLRNELESIDNFRQSLLLGEPGAIVYFQLYIRMPRRNSILSPKWPSTVFCNPSVLQANQYYDAILNWAKLKNFPVILKPVFDGSISPTVKSWLSMLRPMGYSYIESCEKGPHVAVSYPSFVLRSYPVGFSDWKVDPCITWPINSNEITPDYFHNQNTGAVFHMENLENEFREEEIRIMLQFITHRFHLTEIILRKERNSLAEMSDFLTVVNLEDQKTKFLICLVAEDLSYSKTFIKDLPQNIQGIHLEVMNTSTANLDKLLRPINKIPIEKGIVFNIDVCMDVIRLLLNSNVSSSRNTLLLGQIDYIVCRDELSVLSQSDMNYLGRLFDTHLYIKRVYSDLQPHLSLYFRVELIVDLDSNPSQMEPYLRLLTNFKNFGIAYNIRYFLVEAFDQDSSQNRNGWWAIKDFINLTDPYTYIEKVSVYSNQTMWYPPEPTRTDIVTTTSKTASIIAIILTALTFILLALSSFLYFRYKKRSKYLTEEEVQNFISGWKRRVKETHENHKEGLLAAEALKFNPDNEFLLADITIDKKDILGTGNFGTVYKGFVKGKHAAIKTPNSACSNADFKSMLSEVKILAYIGDHMYVVGFVGAYIKEIHKGILYIATELCLQGSLETFLRTKTNVVSRRDQGLPIEGENIVDEYDLHKFSSQIASGMEYISGKIVVHGDLSTRNVFLDETLTCKIGDFGLSRKMYEYQKYVKKSQNAIPWKWMAYETLTKMEFTTKSDVWSYGVVLWEIYSLGCIPFSGLNWTKDFANELQNGMRLPIPKFATAEIYASMLECWDLVASKRPTFSTMAELFKPLCYSEYDVIESSL